MNRNRRRSDREGRKKETRYALYTVGGILAFAFVKAFASNPEMGTSIGKFAAGLIKGLTNFFKALS